jgi:Icc-related predicted phosphoesterase
MKLCIISDTHNKHKHLPPLPKADVIIHAGDFTSIGNSHEIVNFMQWYFKLPYDHKIVIAGNHDWLFETHRLLALEKVPKNVIYLEDSGIEIDGIKFWGSPVQKPFNNWAFNRPEEKLAQHWAAIPDDIDVLITHSPPYSIMDFVSPNGSHEGSPSLYIEVVERIKPKIHIFGHIHESYGIKVIENITFINASNLNGDYMCVNEPFLVEIIDGKVTILNQ